MTEIRQKMFNNGGKLNAGVWQEKRRIFRPEWRSDICQRSIHLDELPAEMENRTMKLSTTLHSIPVCSHNMWLTIARRGTKHDNHNRENKTWTRSSQTLIPKTKQWHGKSEPKLCSVHDRQIITISHVKIARSMNNNNEGADVYVM